MRSYLVSVDSSDMYKKRRPGSLFRTGENILGGRSKSFCMGLGDDNRIYYYSTETEVGRLCDALLMDDKEINLKVHRGTKENLAPNLIEFYEKFFKGLAEGKFEPRWD